MNIQYYDDRKHQNCLLCEMTCIYMSIAFTNILTNCIMTLESVSYNFGLHSQFTKSKLKIFFNVQV